MRLDVPAEPGADAQLPPAVARDRAAQPGATVAQGLDTAVMLLSLGFVERARELLQLLADMPPAGQNMLLTLCDRIAAGEALKREAGLAGDAGEQRSEIMIAPNPRARSVILIFASGPGRYQNVENAALLHRNDASLIHLRNMGQGNYLAGIAGVGTDYAGCVAGFRKIIARLCPAATEPGVFCIGHSLSGYPALRFALDLGARGVLCTSPFTTLRADELPADAAHLMDGQVRVPPELAGSVRPLYLAAEQRPRVILAFGADNRQDCWMADQLRGVPGVTLLPLAGVAEHNSLVELDRNNRFGQLIAAMLSN